MISMGSNISYWGSVVPQLLITLVPWGCYFLFLYRSFPLWEMGMIMALTSLVCGVSE